MNHSSKTYTTIISLLIALLVLSSASLAWFSISSRVDVNDLSMSVTAPSNIYIADGNIKQVDLTASDWDNNLQMNTSSRKIKGKLLLASSATGYNESFYYTETADDNGKPTGTFKRGRMSISATSSEQDTGYYANVPFWIRSDSAETQYLKLNLDDSLIDIDSSGGGRTDGLVLATRVSFLNSDGTAPSEGNDPLIFVHPNYSNRNMFHSPVITAGAASNSDTYGDDIVPITDSTQIIAINNVEKLFVVRVWIEGNDMSATFNNVMTGGVVDQEKLHINITLALTK